MVKIIKLCDVKYLARGSSVYIPTGYGLDGPGTAYRWGDRFSTLVQTAPEVQTASREMGNGSLSRGKSSRGVGLTIHPYIAPRLKKE